MQLLKIDIVFSNNKETNYEKIQLRNNFILYHSIL